MKGKNLNDVSFQDIMNAASKLSDATKGDYTLESLSVWTDYDHLTDFLGKYKTYKDLQAQRGWGVPVDVAAEAYQAIKPELESLNAFVSFMQANFCPYFNLMNDNSDLYSKDSEDYFINTILAGVDNQHIMLNEMVTYLAPFGNVSSPCPDIADPVTGGSFDAENVWYALSVLPAFKDWGSNNHWWISFVDVVEKLQPASTDSTDKSSNNLGGDDSDTTFQDIKDAASDLTQYIQSDAPSFIQSTIQAFSGEISRFAGDYEAYSSGTQTCDTPTAYESSEFKNMFALNHVIVGVSGFLQQYFIPYYNLVLNNQELLSDYTIQRWNTAFNAATYTSDNEYYTSFISLVDALKQFNHLSGPCPSFNDTPLKKQIEVFFSLFAQFDSSAIRTTLIDVTELCLPADSSVSKTSISVTEQMSLSASLSDNEDFADVASMIQDLSTHAADSSMDKINNWTGLSISDFAGYYNVFALDGSSITGYAISDVLDGLLAFEDFAENYFLPVANAVETNPSLFSSDSLTWWKTNFTDATLEASSSTKMSVVDFANEIVSFVKTGDITNIKEGDDSWNLLLTLYNFTPWNSTNAIYKAMIDAPQNMKAA